MAQGVDVLTDLHMPSGQTGNDNLDAHKGHIIGICKGLTIPTSDYDPNETIESIKAYLVNSRTTRLLYSEISNYAFGLNELSLDIMLHNVENLAGYVFNAPDSDVSADCKKIAIKIYDHCNLAATQTKNVKVSFTQALESSKDKVSAELKQDFKKLEREYVTILGLFITIIVTFTGGMSFSASVLNNFHQSSIYRVTLIVVILAAVLITLLYMLMKFIFVLNDKEFKYDRYIGSVIGALLLVAVFILWYYSCHM